MKSFKASMSRFIKAKMPANYLFLPVFFLMTLLVQSQTKNPIGLGAGDIQLNQIGYYPQSPKIVVVANTHSRVWALVDTLGKRVYSGKMKPGGYWDLSGDTLNIADFSEFQKAGVYQLYVPDKGFSYVFRIEPHIYRDALKGALRSYYFQRASMPLEKKYAGIYARAEGHPDDQVYFHASTGRTTGTRPSPGGWYDAGDYNKYIVNAAITVSMMLDLEELFPSCIPDGFSNIPESFNGRNDLLDELKYELDWMLTMQDEDGGVFHKVTNLGFDPFEMPDKAKEKRYFVGKSTSASLCFAATMAQASRVFASLDSSYSARMLRAARMAFEWASANPTAIYSNPKDVSTGAYANSDPQDEFFWAAAELFASTGEKRFHYEFRKNRRPVEFNISENWRLYLRNLGYYTLLTNKKFMDPVEQKELKSDFLALADKLYIQTGLNPYQVPLNRFEWGSNSDVLDAAMLFVYAWKVSGDLKYLRTASEINDYIFGKNATGYCFITGFGSKSPMFPHHRPSGSDGIDAPVPGLLVGGPNSFKQDIGSGAKYASRFPAKAYSDMTASYASNEVAINWNAPLVFMLGFMEEKMDQ